MKSRGKGNRSRAAMSKTEPRRGADVVRRCTIAELCDEEKAKVTRIVEKLVAVGMACIMSC